ncbi:hypothetical protein LguiB_024025 [Lonicera macranthoides]
MDRRWGRSEGSDDIGDRRREGDNGYRDQYSARDLKDDGEKDNERRERHSDRGLKDDERRDRHLDRALKDDERRDRYSERGLKDDGVKGRLKNDERRDRYLDRDLKDDSEKDDDRRDQRRRRERDEENGNMRKDEENADGDRHKKQGDDESDMRKRDEYVNYNLMLRKIGEKDMKMRTIIRKMMLPMGIGTRGEGMMRKTGKKEMEMQARMMKEVQDKSSAEYQHMTWDALRKSINGLVNKVNATNIKNIIPELFAENLIRGRGLFCRSCMKSQMASPGFTDVFAALVAVVNTKFPEVGDLLLRRIILLLQRAYKRNDKDLSPRVRPELDLVELEDQLTHEVSLLDQIDPEITLDISKPDPQFIENEQCYEDFKKTILGDEELEEEADSDADSDDEESDEGQMKIKDETETNLENLRRTIYLTIMSSVDFEEAGHKLLKIKLEPGQEMELCIMLLECRSQERTYLWHYGLLGQRFCMINRIHQENFEKCFVQQYCMIHRLKTNKLSNVAKFFAHLLGTESLPWHVLAYIRLTEEDATSSRIFIKNLFQELSEHLGIRLLNERLSDQTMQDSFESIFPRDTPKNVRFAINFFTSIGLGGITENLREYLKNIPRMIMQQPASSGSDDNKSNSSSAIESGSDAPTSSQLESSSSKESGQICAFQTDF